MLGDEGVIALEAARRKNRRLGRGLSESHVTGTPRERLRQPARIEPLTDRAGIAGLVRDDGRAERLEPGDSVVEPLPHDPLQALVAAWTLRAEFVPLAESPDDAARQQHRAAGPRSLFVDDRRCAELARTHGRAQPGHTPARDD